MNLSREQIEIINRCRKSVTFFLSNFGKIKHPSAGILPFKPFKYQKHALDCFRKYRLNIFRKCRQAGISKISGAFATWFALFHSHKTILIVSRVNEDAMGFLRENIVFLYEHLPDWMVQLWKPLKQNEHEIIFPNGSKIKSLTSHPDVLRSNASSLNIIDEAAFIQGMDVLWAGGWPCVRGDTLIQTSGGLQEIANLASGGNPWKDHSIEVATDIGYQLSDKAYISGKTPTVKLTSYLGLEIEGTGHHRVRIIDESGDYVWQQLDTIKCGDLIAHMPGTFQGRRQLLDDGRELCEDFAEILGLYVGDGFVSSSPHRLKIVFDPQDVATRDYTVAKFNALKFDIQTAAYAETEYDTQNFRLNSKPFVEYMLRNGLKSKTRAQDAQIPAIILRSDKSVLCAFLRGLFDSDGWCYQSSTAMKLGFSTTSAKLAIQVQTALHALGILSRRIMVETDHTPDRNDLRYSDQPYWRVDVWDAKSKIRFRELIGFITKRKQACLDAFKQDASASEIQHSALVSEFASEALRQMMSNDTFRNCTDNRKWNLYRIRRIGQIKFDTAKELIREFRLKSRLAQYITQGLHFDIIEHIENGETETFDLSVPANNTYLANGIVSHNTLQHGGNVIVISTTNGVGNWYWSTCTDAESGLNGFNPVMVNWWDMDWAIEYQDPLSKMPKRIAPCDNIRKSVTADEVSKYGRYWSPWLEEQYRGLQEQGEGWKFKQEVLASFIGSGHTVLPEEVLSTMALTVEDPSHKVTGRQTYIHPVSGEAEELNFDFSDPEEGLWIWEQPVLATPDKKRGDVLIEKGAPAHSYVCGVDISTGKAKDFSAVQVFDVDTMEQVAEFMARVLPRDLVRYIDRIARWYNCATLVIERNNGGDIIVDELRYNMMYPKLWRKKDINDKPQPASAKSRRKGRPLKVSHYGFMTTQSSKASLNKYMLDYFREKDGYAIYSRRLLKQLNTYVRKRDRIGRDTNRTEAEDGAGNFDDLVMAAALALVALSDNLQVDATNLMPTGSNSSYKSQTGPMILTDAGMLEVQEDLTEKGGSQLLMPMSLSPDDVPELAAQRVIDAYTVQLGGIPMSGAKPVVVPNKFFYEKTDHA